MTGVASVVCVEISGNEKSGAAIERCAMTTRATSLWAGGAGIVLRVIEFDVEGLVEAYGKIFERWIVAADVRVADRAHRHLRCRELAAVTVGAGFVTGKARRCRVVAALVT